jgi:glucosamine--fructose-6-phosphate aminotransferase (isomerizing)
MTAAVPGSAMRAEIREQPDALERLLSDLDPIREAAGLLRSRELVRLAAHGTSDAAATYGVYAFGIAAGRTALRDAMSLTVYYDAPLRLAGDAVVAISQSGRTPDVVQHALAARRRGAAIVAVTNDERSPLAEAADLVVPLRAGSERAVAATKTYATTIAALGLLAAEVQGTGAAFAEGVARTVEAQRGLIDEAEAAVAGTVEGFREVERMFVIARGIELATARETALKLTETCRIVAEPLTSTDLSHGPVAAVMPHVPVWLVASGDATATALTEAARRARAAGATLVAVGQAAGTIPDATVRLPVPAAPSPLHAPLLSVIPGQLFACALALARGLDPDAPAGLAKVTEVP